MATKFIIIENADEQFIDCAHLPKPDLELVGRTDFRDHSLNTLLDLRPDMILIGGGESLERTINLIQALLERGQNRILVVGKFCGDGEVLELLIAGANGYLEARLSPFHLEKAVLSIIAGETWVSRKVVALLLNRLRNSWAPA